MKQIIPKKIHYCWFGQGPFPDLVAHCLESWKIYLPEYKIIRWDEQNFSTHSNLFVRQAYQYKKYAYVSDYVRLYALYHHGGIYMDADVEVTKSLDRFLTHPAFSGFEDEHWIPTGIIGAIPKHPWIKKLLGHYKGRPFLNGNNEPDLTPNLKFITKMTRDEFDWKPGNQFQILKDGVYMYPSDFFCPKNCATKQLRITENTHTIHHFNGSWL